MRLCIIGNSHSAALKHGWDNIFDSYSDFSVRFFSAPSSGLKDLEVVGNSLVPNNEKLSNMLRVTSQGEPIIELKDYDAFLLYGLGFSIDAIDRRLSEAVLDAYCKEVVCRSLNFRLSTKILSLVEKPVFMGHVPLQADVGIISPSQYVPYHELCQRISKVLSSKNINLVQQPKNTLAKEIRTLAQYTKGSTRLVVSSSISPALPHPEDDIKHMNGEFGSVYLDEALASLRASPRFTQ